MYVATIPNRNSPPAILLRESYREDGKVKNRTIANLSHWPEEKIVALRSVLKNEPVKANLAGAFEITRSLPHGHVAAVLGTLRSLGLDEIIDAQPSRNRDLVIAMICAQVFAPDSKLAISRGLRSETANSSLGEVLGLSGCDSDDCYLAMDWLLSRQSKIEDELARRHLAGGTLILYDVSSAAFEGRACSLGALGHPKDGVHGRLQIVYGLLTSCEGVPVAIEVFRGNTGDPKTVASQVSKVKERFGITEICLVGDRGMLTKARLRDDVTPAGLDYLTALRAPEIKNLVEGGTIQLSLFDEIDLFEVAHPDFPGERLVACRNPLLGTERARKRQDLLEATERELDKIVSAVNRKNRPLRSIERITARVERVINRHKVAKHFRTEISDTSFSFSRNEDKIAKEASLDGIYVLRTSLSAEVLPTQSVVSAYKSLAFVERAFRAFNTDLDIRPIRHYSENRVRAHVFARMLSYYVSYHMERSLAPLLFRDDDREMASSLRESPVSPALRSPSALAKARTKRTGEASLPVHSFKSLLGDLATITANRITPTEAGELGGFTLVTTPTPLQHRAFELLGVSPRLGYL